MMAQHVGGDAACRFEPCGGRTFRRRLGKHQLLRFEKVALDGRQAGRVRRPPRRVARTARGERCRVGRCECGEATDEVVGIGIGIGRKFAAGPHPVDPGADLVETGQAQVDQPRRHRSAVGSDGGQHVLGGMQRPRHRDEVDDARRTLQRVEGAKGAVEAFPVVRALLEREQVVVALGHELAALDQELLDELVHAGNPHMMETCWTSASWATGFTR